MPLYNEVVRDFFHDIFDNALDAIIFLISALFLLLFFFFGIRNFLLDPLYYLPFILLPVIVVLVPFVFRKEKKS